MWEYYCLFVDCLQWNSFATGKIFAQYKMLRILSTALTGGKWHLSEGMGDNDTEAKVMADAW